MKKLLVILFAIGLFSMSSTTLDAMNVNQVRKDTRFLTDKMAHELDLSTGQYNDVYEINYDFIYNIRSQMDDVINGDDQAMDNYYRYLDTRNDDLRWVLTSSQYRRFLSIDYFYRPVYASGNSWKFRIYLSYSNPLQFFFGMPQHYYTYSGGHYRTHNNNVSYYRNRYHHNIYKGSFSVKSSKVYSNNRRSDFGNARPGRGNGNMKSSAPKRDNRAINQRSVKNNGAYRNSKSNDKRLDNNKPNRSSKPDNLGKRERTVNPSNRSNEQGQQGRANPMKASSRDNSPSKRSDNPSRVSPEKRSSIKSSSEGRKSSNSSPSRDKKGSSDNKRQKSDSPR